MTYCFIKTPKCTNGKKVGVVHKHSIMGLKRLNKNSIKHTHTHTTGSMSQLPWSYFQLLKYSKRWKTKQKQKLAKTRANTQEHCETGKRAEWSPLLKHTPSELRLREMPLSWADLAKEHRPTSQSLLLSLILSHAVWRGEVKGRWEMFQHTPAPNAERGLKGYKCGHSGWWSIYAFMYGEVIQVRMPTFLTVCL